MRIYIAGKVTGMEEEARQLFKQAQQQLQQRYPDATIINPLELDHSTHDKHWTSYMRVCLAELVKCDTIALLPNWVESNGARLEMQVAVNLQCSFLWLKDGSLY